MKNVKAFGLACGLLATCLVLALGIHGLVGHYLGAPTTSAAASCTKPGRNHIVVIVHSAATPASTKAKLCDTLTIKNTDAQIRLMAFGEHDHHQPYDGVTEKVLDKNQSFTITLNQAGTFKFHDHLDDLAQGTFTVR